MEAGAEDAPFTFLGGTTNDTDWRGRLIKLLTTPFFNPVVEDWTDACIKEEESAKEKAAALLYVITPKQYGHYSLVELAVSACMARTKKVVIVFLATDDGEVFDEAQKKSNAAIRSLLEKTTNAEFANTLEEAAGILNTYISGLSA